MAHLGSTAMLREVRCRLFFMYIALLYFCTCNAQYFVVNLFWLREEMLSFVRMSFNGKVFRDVLENCILLSTQLLRASTGTYITQKSLPKTIFFFHIQNSTLLELSPHLQEHLHVSHWCSLSEKPSCITLQELDLSACNFFAVWQCPVAQTSEVSTSAFAEESRLISKHQHDFPGCGQHLADPSLAVRWGGPWVHWVLYDELPTSPECAL